MKKLNNVSVAVLTAVLTLSVVGQIVFAASPATVNLGTAGNFVILSKTGISTTGATSVVGDIGISPAAASYVTGFALTLPSTGAFSTSALITGKIYASDYANPTPASLTTAVLDMQTAYTDAMGRAATVTELGAGNIGGLTFAPGVYKWGTGVTIPTNITISGSANDVWIFQIAQSLNVSSGVKIVLAGGAQASNVFWVVAGQTTLGTTADFSGTILDQTAIVLNTGARLNGRALSQTAVTLDSNPVTVSSAAVVTPTSNPVPTPTPVQTTTTTNSNSTQTTTSNTTSVGASNSTNIVDMGCVVGNIFSITTGRVCTAYVPNIVDVGCVSGNKYSVTTGLYCANFVPVSSVPSFGYPIRMISINLQKGSRGDDVQTLQEFLISQNKGQAAQALANVGATAYFGNLTRAALAEFQARVGIAPALGNFGPITRAYLSSQY